MAKKVARRRKPVRRESKKTNWWVIGGVIIVGVAGLFALLFYSLQAPEGAAVQSLAEYCAQNEGHCVDKGPADAPVTIVEVSDFGCPHCRDFNVQTSPLLEANYVETGQVHWIVMPFALGAATAPSANAALCAAEQGEFFGFMEQMFAQFETPDTRSLSGFQRIAEGLGMDVNSFTDCVNQSRYIDVVRANIDASRTVGVNATPTFFINGRKLEGAQPFSVFQQQIEALLGS
ncbi:MAG: DsbA family protein [Anaerolineae bacterium]